MQTIDLLRDLFAYDLWANRSFLDHLTPGDPLRLYAHIMGSQQVWWGRIQGDAPGAQPWPDLSLDECRERTETTGALWRGYLSHLTEEHLRETIAYTTLAGESTDSLLGDILMHIANHSTYHRAQIARALAQTGIKPPRTDYILYVRERR